MTATVKTKKEACICALSATDTDELAVTRQNDGQDSHDKDLDMQLTDDFTSLIENLKSFQENDLILSKVKQWLLAGSRPEKKQAFRMPRDLTSYWGQFSSLSLENDGKISIILICVPEEKQEEILKMCHSTLLVNHPGIKKHTRNLQKTLYWTK